MIRPVVRSTPGVPKGRTASPLPNSGTERRNRFGVAMIADNARPYRILASAPLQLAATPKKGNPCTRHIGMCVQHPCQLCAARKGRRVADNGGGIRSCRAAAERRNEAASPPNASRAARHVPEGRPRARTLSSSCLRARRGKPDEGGAADWSGLGRGPQDPLVGSGGDTASYASLDGLRPSPSGAQ